MNTCFSGQAGVWFGPMNQDILIPHVGGTWLHVVQWQRGGMASAVLSHTEPCPSSIGAHCAHHEGLFHADVGPRL